MMSLQPFSLPPRWLPLRLLLGGLLAAALTLLLSRRFDVSLAAPAPGLWARCGSSLLVLAVALLLALCIGLIVGLRARQAGARMERWAAFFGRVLACLPVPALAWGFIGGWIGTLGWPVESLMPAQFPDAQGSWHTALACTLWEHLAPALILALPLCGEMIQGVIADGGDTIALDFSLRARGVPPASRLWFHHLSQLWPMLRVRLQSLCLVAPVYLIIIEDALHFMGWGDWLAQSLRAADPGGIALGFATGGALMALLCACLHLLSGRLKTTHGLTPTLAWQPWLLWALGLLALFPSSPLLWGLLWLVALISGSAGWLQAWNQIERDLPKDASRVAGASEGWVWRHHIAPLQLRMLIAWLCLLFAQTLLAVAVACALLPRLLTALSAPLAKIYHPLAIATVQDAAQTLTDPAALLWSGGIIALAALCLAQVSRILQPRPL